MSEAEARNIARLAIRVERARQALGEIRARRSAYGCETPTETDRWDDAGKKTVECWRAYEWRYRDLSPLEPEKWCPSCLARQKEHQLYRVAAAKLGARRGALTKACQRAMRRAA